MTSGKISDAQIIASTSLDDAHRPMFARVGNHSSWRPAVGDLQPHIEIVFPSRMIFTGILVQGEGIDDGAFVESFFVGYSNENSGTDWIMDFTQLDIIDVVSRRLLSSCRKADHTSIRKC